LLGFVVLGGAELRPASPAPDERTITQVRGDRNRAFLMD
jgi:hypothetical protein